MKFPSQEKGGSVSVLFGRTVVNRELGQLTVVGADSNVVVHCSSEKKISIYDTASQKEKLPVTD